MKSLLKALRSRPRWAHSASSASWCLTSLNKQRNPRTSNHHNSLPRIFHKFIFRTKSARMGCGSSKNKPAAGNETEMARPAQTGGAQTQSQAPVTSKQAMTGAGHIEMPRRSPDNPIVYFDVEIGVYIQAVSLVTPADPIQTGAPEIAPAPAEHTGHPLSSLVISSCSASRLKY
ncbi:hypothetical protein BCR34DRAFT_669880 [Clohesyomyces aquaticus]|uniref:Uncharacterized protein n=1 Tax=Clohesyomyces aquaticus TaxID=1231657 RepID=A0A1Y1Y6K2_9PLEO|nr:hypothetical protein BCR34DRAFT_669880 [Clohesyomyces aquaticus]